MWTGTKMAVLAASLGAGMALAQNTSKPGDTPPAPPPAAEPAQPSGETIGTITAPDLAAIFQEIGWTAEAKEVDGKPGISASYTDGESGTVFEFSVGLYRCDEASKACLDVMFMRSTEVSKPVTLAMVNKYNASQIFGVAYLNDDGSLGVSMSMTLQGGVTRQNIKEMADWWKTIVTGFDAKVTGS